MQTPNDPRTPVAIVASMSPERLRAMAGASGSQIAGWYGDATDVRALKAAARDRIAFEAEVSWDTLVAEASL